MFKSKRILVPAMFDVFPITNTMPTGDCQTVVVERYRKLNTIYLQIMYDAKWFPHAGYGASVRLLKTMIHIMCESRGISQRYFQKIDRAIFSYYSNTKIQLIKRSWKHSALSTWLKKTLGEAIEAYCRGEYVLTICCLSSMWENLIYIKANPSAAKRIRQKMRITKTQLGQLINKNHYANIFFDYFNHFVISNCNKTGDGVEGVPNRHEAAHGWYTKYPSRKAALNAILLTDFIVHLKPLYTI